MAKKMSGLWSRTPKFPDSTCDLATPGDEDLMASI
jgi:hypothetical protein